MGQSRFPEGKKGSGVDSGTQKRGQEHSGIIKPNDLLQQTGHATDAHSGFNGPSRVSRLLSCAFGHAR